MMIPVTSTSVATNGADVTAGSRPRPDKIKGSMDPDRFPKTTTPNKLNPIVPACKITCIEKSEVVK